MQEFCTSVGFFPLSSAILIWETRFDRSIPVNSYLFSFVGCVVFSFKYYSFVEIVSLSWQMCQRRFGLFASSYFAHWHRRFVIPDMVRLWHSGSEWSAFDIKYSIQKHCLCYLTLVQKTVSLSNQRATIIIQHLLRWPIKFTIFKSFFFVTNDKKNW